MKTVAILQSCYIPWKGYFDMISAVDEFILYDDMQFTRRDWRNRNKIKTPNGPLWLTVPVQVKGKFFQSIRETQIDGTEWADTHWKTITQNYKRAPYFDQVTAMIEPAYRRDQPHTHLSELNRELTEIICKELGIETKLSWSWDYNIVPGKTERLVDLCLQAGATRYISGPAAKDYIVDTLFEEAGIELEYFSYAGYPEYPQLWGGFEHAVTILDLLFNCGPEASQFMRYVPR